jgi:D-galactarolactone cycloisomerase
VQGVVAIPDGPGLGIEIDRAALAEFRPRDA